MTLLIILAIGTVVTTAFALKNGIKTVTSGFKAFGTSDATKSNEALNTAGKSFKKTFKWNALASLFWLAFIVDGVVLLVQHFVS